ncbi:MAG: hypothetical protein WAT39_25600 [Planctomycetota bacterium]
MQRSVSWASPLLFAAVLAAQQGTPDPAAPKLPPAERLAALQAEQKQLIADWQQQRKEQAKQAPEPGKAVPAIAMRPDFDKVVAQAKAAAAEYAGTADAPPFLVFVVQTSSKKEDRIEALDALTEKHVDHAAVAELAPMLQFMAQVASPERAKVYAERLAKSANADVRGWALFAGHRETIEKADVAGDAYKAAKAELAKVAELASDERLKGEIQDAIVTREKFGIGNVAPDIEGEDLDGVAFKLSDYKGKVIFLDFWGDW